MDEKKQYTAEEWIEGEALVALWLPDETLLEVAVALVQDAKVDGITIVGDMCDMCEALWEAGRREMQTDPSLPRYIIDGLRAYRDFSATVEEQKQCSAADWVEGAPITDLWLPGETIEEAAAATVSDAREHGVEIFGDMVAALWEWGCHERRAVHGLPHNILAGIAAYRPHQDAADPDYNNEG